MAVIPINQHTESLSDGSQIVWPAVNNLTAMPAPNASTTLPPLTVNPGDLIIANRSPNLSLTSSDGSLTLTFGSYLNGTTFTGTGHNSAATHPYSGPYCSVSPTLFNAEDPYFHGLLEVLGKVDTVQQSDGSYTVFWFSGRNATYGSTLVDDSVSANHLAPSHPHDGNFVGAQIRLRTVTGGGTYHVLEAVGNNPGDLFEWHTDDGTGDNMNVATGVSGAYVIAKTGQSSLTGDIGWVTQGFITENTGAPTPIPFANWANNTPPRNMIAFCKLFPGSSSAPVVSGTGGSYVGAAGQGYSIRFAFTKSLTLLGNYSKGTLSSSPAPNATSATLTGAPSGLSSGMRVELTGGPNPAETLVVGSPYSGGTTVPFTGLVQYSGHTTMNWGTFAQNIETPLSTEATVAIGSGSTNSIQFTIPQTPAGWTGVNIYVGSYNTTGGTTPKYEYQLLGTNYTLSGQTVTLTSFGASSSTGPSFGFSAWPSGTFLAKDPNAIEAYLMKVSHVSAETDPNTGNYTLHDYQSNSSQSSSGHLPPSSIQPEHPNAINSPADGNALTYQASSGKFNWVTPSSGMANPMTTGGDIIYGGTPSGGVAPPDRLALPTTAPALLVAGNAFGGTSPGQPVWASASAETGDIPYTDSGPASGWSFLRPGSNSGKFLQNNGLAAPIWDYVSEVTTDGSNLLSIDGNNHVAISLGSAAISAGSISVGAAFGTVTSLTASGDDCHFSFSFTSGTISASSSGLITITLGHAAANANYRVSAMPTTIASAPWQTRAGNLSTATFTGLRAGCAIYVASRSTTQLVLGVEGNLLDSTGYGWDVHVFF